MAQTNRIIFHHEGSGAPGQVNRPLHEDYSISIGDQPGQYVMNRPPNQSFRTGCRGNTTPALQIVFPGNRDIYHVSDVEIKNVELAVADARGRGWVTDYPEVTNHDDMPCESTACPGKFVREVMPKLTVVCKKSDPIARPPQGEAMATPRVAQPGRRSAGGRQGYAELVVGHGVALVNGADVVGSTGPTVFGNWLLIPAPANAYMIDLLEVPEGIVIVLNDVPGATYGPYPWK